VTGHTKISPSFLNGLKEFNEFKQLVANSSEKNGKVDIELLKSLIDQVNLRCKILAIEARCSDLDLGKDPDEIYKDALNELSKTKPASVESQLAEDGQVLDTIDQKLNSMNETMIGLTEDVNDKFSKLMEEMAALRTEVAK